MLFDPDAGKSIEDIILEAWEYKITPQRRAEILAIAEESGRTWFEVVCGYMQDSQSFCEEQVLSHPSQFKSELGDGVYPTGRRLTANAILSGESIEPTSQR